MIGSNDLGRAHRGVRCHSAEIAAAGRLSVDTQMSSVGGGTSLNDLGCLTDDIQRAFAEIAAAGRYVRDIQCSDAGGGTLLKNDLGQMAVDIRDCRAEIAAAGQSRNDAQKRSVGGGTFPIRPTRRPVMPTLMLLAGRRAKESVMSRPFLPAATFSELPE